MLLDPAVNADALTWAADADKASTPAIDSVGQGSSLVRWVHLTRQSQNITPAGKTLVSRWAAGRLRWRVGASTKAISDDRGPVVASVGMRRTSPRPTTVARMVDRYEAGATLREVADEFGVHRMTVSRALKRAGVTLRRSGLGERATEQAVELYEGGMTLVEVGNTRESQGPRSVVRCSVGACGCAPH